MANWLVVLGHAEGIRWVLEHGQMAFPEGRCRRASSIGPADLLFFYVAKGAYGQPNRDQAQLLGVAETKESVRDLEQSVVIGGRQFTYGCALRFEKLLPERQDVPFEPLVPQLRLL